MVESPLYYLHILPQTQKLPLEQNVLEVMQELHDFYGKNNPH